MNIMGVVLRGVNFIGDPGEGKIAQISEIHGAKFRHRILKLENHMTRENIAEVIQTDPHFSYLVMGELSISNEDIPTIEKMTDAPFGVIRESGTVLYYNIGDAVMTFDEFIAVLQEPVGAGTK